MFFGPPGYFFNLYVDLEKNLVTIFKQKNHCDKECGSQISIEYVLLNPSHCADKKEQTQKGRGTAQATLMSAEEPGLD